MLVLSRKIEEGIVLLELGVTFKILEVKKGVVKVGIVAPKEIQIVRKELLPKDSASTDATGVATAVTPAR